LKRRFALAALVVLAASLATAHAASAATFVVNSDDDADDGLCAPAPGHCSLREAINAANGAAGLDTIGFSIGVGGPRSITLLSQLPAVTDGVVIDGTTQGSFEGEPIIEVEGSGVEQPAAVGIWLAGETPSTVRGLVVNRFSLAGIRISGAAGSQLELNYLGTDMTGTADLGSQIGVLADVSSSIGGFNPNERNVISGNQVGVYVSGAATGVNILGNYIGTNAAGTAALPNTDGIFIDGADENDVGNVEGGPNVIAGNEQFGVRIQGGTGNRVVQNRIGTDLAGERDLGNGQTGVQIVEASGNRVDRNIIRFNGFAGAHVQSGTVNFFTRNRMSSNDGLGIDLGPGGVTPNDDRDPDAGANNLQNFPVIDSAVTNGTDSIVIEGTLNTVVEETARLEFFASASCDPSEHGEGERFLGTTDVQTLGGQVGFSLGYEVSVAAGEAITATASIGDSTSEFSKCIEAQGLDGGGSIVVNSDADPGDGECTRSNCTLREAIEAANAAAGADTITFAIPFDCAQAPCVVPIELASALPDVNDPVVIDGTTQFPSQTGPGIGLNGSDVSEAPGLVLAGGNSTVRGLVITNFGGGAGIYVPSNENVVQGNYVGTNVSWSTQVGNDRGITVAGSDNTIQGNVVASSDSWGVRLLGDANRVLGNSIGTDPSGSRDLGNLTAGVLVSSSENQIGGTAAGAGNDIAFNGSSATGVNVVSGTGNAIRGNSIRSSVGLGIDLGSDGRTANDPGDDDGGANNQQNFPVITSAEKLGTNVVVSGELDSAPSTRYELDLFLESSCDPSGNGEGPLLLGSTAVTTTPSGDASFALTLPVTGPGGFVTATATDPAGNTSEFSACAELGLPSGLVAMTSPADCAPTEDGGRTISFEEPGEGPLANRYASLGLRFTDDETTTPIFYSNTEERQTSSNPTSAANDADAPNTSAGVPLTILFDEPQTAVGFFAGNAETEPLTATIRAYGDDDVLLGALQVSIPVDDVTTFRGVMREDGGILKVTLDYGSSTLSEEIDDLCFLGPPLEETSGELTITVDQGSNPAGSATRVVPLSSIPANQLPSFSGSPAAAPVGSIPVGSIPVGSIPVGSIPVGSIPVGSIPVGSIPVGSIPVGSIPVGSIGLESIPVGSIGLDQILLSSLPVDWAPIFAGTPKQGVPVQTLTLADVYDQANAPARTRFEALTFAQSGLAQTLLGGVPLAALLLGEKHLNQLPPPGASTWCAALVAAGGDCAGLSPSSNTVVGLAVAGAPVGSIPVGSIPVGSIGGGIAGTPVGSIPLRDIDIAATRLALIKLVDIPNVNTVVDCAALGGCTGSKTLGDAAAASPSAIRLGVTLSALQAVLGNITLNEIIIGLLPRSALAWEGFPIDGLQLFTPEPRELHYAVDFDLVCGNKAGLAITVKLPDGYVVRQGTSKVKYGNAATVNAPNPVTNAKTGARWTGLPEPCGSLTTQHVKLTFDALSAFELGLGRASAVVSAGGTVDRATDQAPVLVTQNWETNDDTETAKAIAPDQLVVGHIARSGDQEVFTTAIPAAPGTITTFYLSHLAPGADFDLVIGAPATPPLQSSPVGSIPVGSIPVEDHGSDVDNSRSSLPSETLQDIPVGSIPVGSISANRGNVDEVAEVVSRGETGVYTIVVRGYNGSYSREPFVLRVKRTPAAPLPPCVNRGLSVGAPGVLPPGVAGDRRSLFLVNKSRMEALYGVPQTATMLLRLGDLAARDEVRGAILQVDGNAAVRAAYEAWDANPCDVEAANGVVRSINDVVAGYRGSLPDLRYVVLLGTDDAMPMARVPDRVSVSPERDFETDLRFTTQNLQQGNALYAATARSYVLTDGAYGAFTHIQWLGRELFLPQVSVSRLVETPDDIRLQVEQYLNPQGDNDPLKVGKLDPSTALGTDYDFLDDGGQAVFDALAALVQTSTHLENTWNRQDLVDRFTGKTPPDDINAVNAHYSQWQIQPQTAANANDLVTTADLADPAPAVEPAFRNRILFTMGCHANFNVPNSYFSGPVPQQGRDWSEKWARQRAAVYVANTGYGYGDTVTNALSERLMTLFAQNLGRDETIGEIFLRSLHDYFDGAGAYDVYDEKVLIETSMRGLPFWQIAGATSPPPPTPPMLEPDTQSGLDVARLTIAPGAVRQPASLRGAFWSSQLNTQVTHFRPIQPRAERNVTVPGLVAHGVIVKALSTTDVTGIDPVLATPTIDLSENEPERNFRPPYWPASFVNLTRSRQLGSDRQSLVVNAGQFRAITPLGKTGTERVVTSINVDVLYSSSPDFVPPAIHQVSAVFTGGTVRIFVRATDSGPLRRATALVNDGGGWRFLELNREGDLWTGLLSGLAGEPEIAVTVQDDAGNTAQSTNKAVNFTPTVDTDGPDILIESPLPEQVVTLNAVVNSLYSCSEAAGVQTCAGPVPSGAPIDTSRPGRRPFTVNATSFSGAQRTLTHEYIVRYAFQGFLFPVDNPPIVNHAKAGKLIPLKWRLRDANGAFIRDLASVKSITSRQISCTNGPADEIEQLEPAGGSQLEYVLSEENFKYRWQTQAAWRNTCRRITVELADGTKPFADFLLR
jgi:CSLREA domain-containing protein